MLRKTSGIAFAAVALWCLIAACRPNETVKRTGGDLEDRVSAKDSLPVKASDQRVAAATSAGGTASSQGNNNGVPYAGGPESLAQWSLEAEGCKIEKMLPEKPLDLAGPLFSWHTAHWMSALSQFAYEDVKSDILKKKLEAKGFTDYEFFSTLAGTQGYLVSKGESLFLVFRGSQGVKDWFGNFQFSPKVPSELGLTGQVHGGFLKDVVSVSSDLLKSVHARIAGGSKKLFITGHSLGGATAVLAAAYLAAQGIAVEALYTFGQPRVGNDEFLRQVDRLLPERYFRFANFLDPVARIPATALGARDFVGMLENWNQKGLVIITQALVLTNLMKASFHHTGRVFFLGKPQQGVVTPPVETTSDAEDLAFWSSQKNNIYMRDIVLNVQSLNQLKGDHSDALYSCRLQRLSSQ